MIPITAVLDHYNSDLDLLEAASWDLRVHAEILNGY